MKTQSKTYLLSLVEGAMMLALAFVIDYVCALAPYNAILFPAGGTITVGMLPIVYYAYRRGTAWGVGAGLVFAGVTGFCGLALVLAKMPWNRDCGGNCPLKR